MVRHTSIEAFNTIKEKGLLSERRFEVYRELFQHGPCTANELFKKMRGISQVSQANIQPRLNELVAFGVAREVTTRECMITGNTVLVYDVTDRLPLKLDKPKKIKCPHCNGKGHIISQQTRFNL